MGTRGRAPRGRCVRTFALHPFVEGAHSFKVGVLGRVVRDDQAGDLDLARLEELVQAIGIFLVAVRVAAGRGGQRWQ